jgi:RNA polymerase-associated protein RTF1
MQGCFVRVSVGVNSETKHKVYRLCQIQEVIEYHRSYQFGQVKTKLALSVTHGKARKTFLMDIASNSDFTESEWNRYQKTVTSDKEQMIAIEKVHSLQKELAVIRAHVVTHVSAIYVITG